jgi:hypothetical protein
MFAETFNANAARVAMKNYSFCILSNFIIGTVAVIIAYLISLLTDPALPVFFKTVLGGCSGIACLSGGFLLVLSLVSLVIVCLKNIFPKSFENMEPPDQRLNAWIRRHWIDPTTSPARQVPKPNHRKKIDPASVFAGIGYFLMLAAGMLLGGPILGPLCLLAILMWLFLFAASRVKKK